MLSSTSSSEIKVLRADGARTWAAAAALSLLLLAGWEYFWRAKGFRPVINDDAGLWSAARRSVRPDSVVLIGSSRMRAGVHAALFEEATGRHTVQLAMNAQFCYPALEHLSRDRAFKGTLICDISEIEIASLVKTDMERGFIGAYERERPVERSEATLRRLAHWRLAFTSPELSPQPLLRGLLHGQLPAPLPRYATVTEDRTLRLDFSMVDIEKVRQYIADTSVYQGPPMTPEEFVERAGKLESLAEEIERRGGRVVFVRFPVSGVLWERLEKTYPKASYWDEWARRTRFPTIHFKDYPSLRVECTDYMHLDVRDAPGFTRALARIIFGDYQIEGGLGRGGGMHLRGGRAQKRPLLPDGVSNSRHIIAPSVWTVGGIRKISSLSNRLSCKEEVAERVGFEPTVELPPLRFSRPVH